MEKPKCLISFSGGETSAYMTKWMLEEFRDSMEMIVVFANTGEENEQTLEFVNRCDKELGFGTVWIESVVNPIYRKGITHKIVTFETASRNGEPFEAVIEKYGIPNVSTPNCSRDMKQRAILHYAKSIGWKDDYQTAIGIRADEIDRMSSTKEITPFYPLVKAGITKPFVNRFWRDMPFRLELKGYEGNCKTCWKKSLRKLLTIAKENPKAFDNFKKWEKKYENFIPDSRKHNPDIKTPIRFFRDNLSVQDIMKMSKKPFEPAENDAEKYTEYKQLQLDGFDLDVSNGCVESCEVF